MRYFLLIVPALCFISACSPAANDMDANKTIGPAQVTGTLSYRERILLRPGTVAEVWLLDVSKMDVAAVELAHQVIENPGAPPIPFALGYDEADIDERLSYSVRATIKNGNRLLFTTDTHYPVLTRGAGDTVEIELKAIPQD